MVRLVNRRAFIPLFFVFVFTISLLLVPVGFGQSYYNWFENDSFGGLQNYCEDGGFESGVELSGLTYGNWTMGADWIYDSYAPAVNNGVYCVKYYGNTATDMWYNLTSSAYILGADVLSLVLHAKFEQDVDQYVKIHYQSGNSDNCLLEVGGVTMSYIEFDLTSQIDVTEVIVALQIDASTSADWYLDDVEFYVDVGSEQSEIDMSSSPWYLGAVSQNNFGYINTVTGRTDTYSVQFSGTSTSQFLGQNIAYLDTESVYYIDCYVYGADVADSDGFKCTVLYSDRTSTSQTRYVTGNGTSWEYLNFGKTFISEGKFIIAVWFSQLTSGTFLLDDFGLWSSLDSDTDRFDFTVSPSVISSTEYSFSAYSSSAYTVTCNFYNSTTHTMTDNGTVTITTDMGQTTVNMTNGLFTFQLSDRDYFGSPYTLEHISIVVVTGYEIFPTTISVYWYPASSSSSSSNTLSEVMGGVVEYGKILLIMVICPAIVGVIFKNVYLFGLAMPVFTVIGMTVGLVGFIHLIISVLVAVFIVIGASKGSGSGSVGVGS